MPRKSTKAPPVLATIREILRAQRPTLQQRYGVRYLGIFGSYARGEANARSDLDLLVESDTPPSLLRFIELENHLSDL